MERRLRWLAGAVILALTASACGGTVTSLADYPHYGTAEELFDTATLVVEADVANTSRVTRQPALPAAGDDPVTNPQAGAPPGEEPDALVMTVRTARIVTVYKGAAKAGDTIEVGQSGGTIDGVRHEQAEAVPLTGGARHVLFLETFDNAPAVLLNPTQGQYRVGGDGTVSAVADNPLRLSRADLDRLAARRPSSGPG